MKKKVCYLTISFIILILFFSCDNEAIDESAFKDSNSEVTVLLERDYNYPLKLVSDSYIERNKMNTRSVQPEPPSSSFTNYLGQGYNVTAIPIADPAYITSPVIDMSKLLRNPNDSSTYYKKLRYNRSYPEYFAFSNYYRYSHNSQVSDKIGGGGSANFILLNIGAQKTIQTVFKNNFTEIDSTAYAELHLNIYKHIYRMNIVTTYDKYKFTLNYLHPVFIEDLYNSNPKEILDKYGHFILNGFYTGGTCTALFGAKFHRYYTEQSREIILSDSVYAGFKMEENTANGNLYIKLGRSESSSTSDNTSTIFLTMKTIGGSSGYPTAFSIPMKFSDVNINLSTWGNSLDTNEDNHELIYLTDGGLLPITDFVLEEDINLFLEAGGSDRPIREPYFLVKKLISPRGTFTYSIHLHNRFGCDIIINTEESGVFNNVEESVVVNYIRDYFKAPRIQMVTESSHNQGRNDFQVKLNRTIMKKYTNPATGVLYLLSDDGYRKSGFSIAKDFLLDTYGLREFLNTIPEISLSIQQLTQYKIYSL